MNGNFVLLLDIYGELLSKTQREALDLKYNSDLSLSEIAEEMGGISRQSVNEAQKNGEKKLLELEKVLGNAEKLALEKKLVSEAAGILEDIRGENADERLNRLAEILSELEKAI